MPRHAHGPELLGLAACRAYEGGLGHGNPEKLM